MPLRRRPRRPILVVPHSPPGQARAEQLFGERTDANLVFAGAGASGTLRALGAILRSRPRLVYLIDVGMSTTAASVAARVLRCVVVLDTGDLAYELARSIGSRRGLRLAVVKMGERLALRCTHHVVVRGRAHLDLVPQPATFVPDVAPQADGVDPLEVRRVLGLDPDAFIVGLVGSLNVAPRLGTCYGWDLIEALRETSPRVNAVIIGNGDGRAMLEQRADALGVSARCHFVGRVRADRVHEWVAGFDVGVSTQTNDAVGAVRTTGKVPLYLACGCPVIASDVGEAHTVLGPHGWTLPYHGVVDRAYPDRLARAITAWSEDAQGQAERRRTARSLAREHYDVRTMRARVGQLLSGLLTRSER